MVSVHKNGSDRHQGELQNDGFNLDDVEFEFGRKYKTPREYQVNANETDKLLQVDGP